MYIYIISMTLYAFLRLCCAYLVPVLCVFLCVCVCVWGGEVSRWVCVCVCVVPVLCLCCVYVVFLLCSFGVRVVLMCALSSVTLNVMLN